MRVFGAAPARFNKPSTFSVINTCTRLVSSTSVQISLRVMCAIWICMTRHFIACERACPILFSGYLFVGKILRLHRCASHFSPWTMIVAKPTLGRQPSISYNNTFPCDSSKNNRRISFGIARRAASGAKELILAAI